MKIFKRGFTLIELIIVIAVLGILAAGLLAALDPIQQVRRGNDGATRNAAYEAVRAGQRFYTASNPNAWPASIAALVTAGELKSANANLSWVVNGTNQFVCFIPQSASMKQDPNTKYTAAAAATCAVSATSSCDYCIQAN